MTHPYEPLVTGPSPVGINTARNLSKDTSFANGDRVMGITEMNIGTEQEYKVKLTGEQLIRVRNLLATALMRTDHTLIVDPLAITTIEALHSCHQAEVIDNGYPF